MKFRHPKLAWAPIVLMLAAVPLAPAVVFAQDAPQALPFETKQQRQFIRTGYEQLVRGRLSFSRVDDKAVQDAVVSWSEDQREAAEPLQLQAQALSDAVASKAVSEAEISVALSSLRAALRAEKERRSLSLADLKAKTGYDKAPRLELALTFFGVIGDQAAVLNGVPQGVHRMLAHSVPEALAKFGLKDEVLQETLVKYVSEQEKSLQPMLAQAYNNQLIEMTLPTTATDESRRLYLAELRAATARFQVRRDKALGRLDAVIGYSKNPRLEATLYLLGILGEEPSVLEVFDPSGALGFRRHQDLVTGKSTR